MSGSLYGMQGLGTTGLGVGSDGAMPGGGQINPQMLAALMQQHGVGTPFQPQGQSPMSALMQHAAPMGGGVGPQPGQMPQVQQPQSFAQAAGQPGAQGSQSPLGGLLGQLTQGQNGVQPQQSQAIPPELLARLREMSASPVPGANGFNVGGT